MHPSAEGEQLNKTPVSSSDGGMVLPDAGCMLGSISLSLWHICALILTNPAFNENKVKNEHKVREALGHVRTLSAFCLCAQWADSVLRVHNIWDYISHLWCSAFCLHTVCLVLDRPFSSPGLPPSTIKCRGITERWCPLKQGAVGMGNPLGDSAWATAGIPFSFPTWKLSLQCNSSSIKVRLTRRHCKLLQIAVFWTCCFYLCKHACSICSALGTLLMLW